MGFIIMAGCFTGVSLMSCRVQNGTKGGSLLLFLFFTLTLVVGFPWLYLASACVADGPKCCKVMLSI